MSQTLVAPATMSPGSVIDFPDGTTATIAADSTVSVPNGFIARCLNAGFTYAAATSSQTSQSASKADSGGLVASSANSTASSEATGDSQSVSTADSKGVSSGLRASTGDSKAVSDALVLSTLTSRVTSAGA